MHHLKKSTNIAILTVDNAQDIYVVIMIYNLL